MDTEELLGNCGFFGDCRGGVRHVPGLKPGCGVGSDAEAEASACPKNTARAKAHTGILSCAQNDSSFGWAEGCGLMDAL
jgi:hypothetical protein